MASTPNEVIIVEALSKTFGQVTAVDQVSFIVRQGEIFGILGPNGAGKTTTLECIEGIQEPSAGRAIVLGIDTLREPEKVKQKIGVQLQASAYFDYLTLTEILELFGLFYNRRVSAQELLSKVELQDKAKVTVDELSGGQRQRFSIAATLVNDAELIFLDEPTTGLDPQARRSLWEFIQEINREGRTVVLTTHYMEEAESLCHRVAIMDRGVIVALDTPTNLIRSLPLPFEVKAIMEQPNRLEDLETLPGVQELICDGDGAVRLRSSDAATTVPALMEWVNTSGTRLTHLAVTPPNLEDVFLSLTSRGLRD